MSLSLNLPTSTADYWETLEDLGELPNISDQEWECMLPSERMAIQQMIDEKGERLDLDKGLFFMEGHVFAEHGILRYNFALPTVPVTARNVHIRGAQTNIEFVHAPEYYSMTEPHSEENIRLHMLQWNPNNTRAITEWFLRGIANADSVIKTIPRPLLPPFAP